MKIILLKSVEKLGKEGDVVEVKDGFGRNYLLPNKIALPANQANLKKIEEIKKGRKKKEEKEKEGLLKLKEKIASLSLTITAEAKEDESLYGSVKEAQILKLLQQEGIELPKESLTLEKPIDRLGAYKVLVKLSENTDVAFRLWVVSS